MRRLLLLCLLTLISSACHADELELKPQKLSEHVWFVEGHSALGSKANRNFISNAGIIVGPDGVVLVDALGSPELARALLIAVKSLTDKPLRAVVLTHYHADHVYGLQVLKAAGAKIIAQQAGREYLNSDTAAQRLQASIDQGLVEPGTRLVPADEWIGCDSPQVAPMGRPAPEGRPSARGGPSPTCDTPLNIAGLTLQLIPVGPAHTPEDLAVWLPDDKLIFAGDLVFRGRLPFVGQADSRRWIASLDRLLTRPAAIVVPGHGPASTDALKDLLQTRDYLAYLRATMGRAAREMTPFDEAYAATDWSAWKQLPLFEQANRMNAFNTYLLMEHEGD